MQPAYKKCVSARCFYHVTMFTLQLVCVMLPCQQQLEIGAAVTCACLLAHQPMHAGTNETAEEALAHVVPKVASFFVVTLGPHRPVRCVSSPNCPQMSIVWSNPPTHPHHTHHHLCWLAKSACACFSKPNAKSNTPNPYIDAPTCCPSSSSLPTPFHPFEVLLPTSFPETCGRPAIGAHRIKTQHPLPPTYHAPPHQMP